MTSPGTEPDFNAVGLPVFEAADGVLFAFPWEPLVVASSFFRDLKSLPPPTEEHQDSSSNRSIIPLPSATSNGLKATFQIIHRTTHSLPLFDHLPHEAETLVDMNVIADAYDLTSVIEKVCEAYKRAGSYFVPFCFATLAEEVDQMNILSFHLLHETTKKEVPDWLCTVLQANAPIAQAKLLLMYHVRETNLDANAFKSRADHMLEHSYGGFLKKCVRNRCSEYRIADSKWFINLAAPRLLGASPFCTVVPESTFLTF
ncbi:uncharacterized protein EHS24_000434 [Apiotrichum porosum]|uniref:Uncharacterized protein n=1 Tax=Apiotrichum porosum TaxID=105984 RepID=A0A427YA71_9TREE|nr:uncharacterized protein EHS24_000434 [Apiotrichum porosum]RSH87915.1 hypothetical protein EHS24_000434 [Apiotrichum porosum]